MIGFGALRAPTVGTVQAAQSTPAYRGGTGSPLLLLHGFGASWRAWLPVLPLLAAQHAVFAPTLPGHCGAAPLPPGVPPSVTALADSLERQLDAEGIERPHISGNSMGGWLALEMARRGRARSVVALSPGGAWQAEARMARTLAKVRLGQRLMSRFGGDVLDPVIARPAVRRLLLRQMVEHGDRVDPVEIKVFMRDLVECPVFQPLIASIPGKQLASVPARGDCPIRIAWGEHDRVIPFRYFGPAMRDRVRHAEFVIMPGVGHVPMVDNPELVVNTILELTRPEEAGRDAG